jgi:hypothetical protein
MDDIIPCSWDGNVYAIGDRVDLASLQVILCRTMSLAISELAAVGAEEGPGDDREGEREVVVEYFEC